MKLVKFALAAAVVALAPIAPQAFAEKAEIYTKSGNIAISGYDAVSYFSGKPQQGDPKYAITYKGAVFEFANAENAAKFKANPVAYAPQYGGYCAYGVANNKTVSSDPLAWTVLNGKLYLNYNDSIQKKWEGSRDSYIKQADVNWPSVRK